MENEFVPYDKALRMKELGFDEPCFGFYNNTITESVIINNDSYGGFGLTQDHVVVAPTFSQAFRWFREEYGYLSYIDMDNYSFYRYTIYKGKGISEAPYETYEEAELACLEKLIEIVESKSV